MPYRRMWRGDGIDRLCQMDDVECIYAYLEEGHTGL